jgi:pimeloyl-ACP methyl ester carboxylesterase
MYNPTLPHLLRRLKTLQTLIISGKQDSIVPFDSLRIYNESIPGSSLSLIDQSGHRPEIEKPEDFLKVVTNFLK